MATGVDQQEYVDKFEQFFREYYRDEIGELARGYPSERKSIHVDYDDLYRYDRELAEQYLEQPAQLQRAAEEALRLYDLPVDVSLGYAHVRLRNLPERTRISELGSANVNTLVALETVVEKADDVKPKCTEAAFRCVRCETMTRVPLNGGDFQEPYECRSCERQGPFRLDEDQSEFVDGQQLKLREVPHNQAGGNRSQSIYVEVEDDIAGEVSAGSPVVANGVLRLDQDGEKESSTFDVFLEAVSIESAPDLESEFYDGEFEVVDDLRECVALVQAATVNLPENVNEEETKAKFITPMLQALGWNFFDNREVRMEYERGGRKFDYALFGPNSDSPSVLVEAKKYGLQLTAGESQLAGYMQMVDAEWGIAINGKEVWLYHNSLREGPSVERVAEIPVEEVHNATVLGVIARSAYYDDPGPRLSHLEDDQLGQLALSLIPRSHESPADRDAVVDELVDLGVPESDAEGMLDDLLMDGELFEPEEGVISRL